MTKAATMETRRFVTMLLLAAMMIAVIPLGLVVLPGGLLAADNGSVTGRFGVNSENVTVNSVYLYNGDNTSEVGSMDPTSFYVARVSVTHKNTLNFLDKIELAVYYDEDGTFSTDNVPASGDPQNGVIMTWDGTDNWTMEAGGSGTWDIVESECDDPAVLGAHTTYVFMFKFKVGTVAKESDDDPGDDAKWHIYAKAWDTGGGTSYKYQDNLEMTWYGAITVGLSGGTHLEFGNLDLGSENQTSTNSVTATYISNGNYDRNIRTVGTWSGNNYSIALDTAYDGSPDDGEFALKADDDSSIGGAVIVRTTYVAMEEAIGITSESGTPVSGMTVWITLAAAGINADTYTGTIYYQISNG
ncbi:MAG: hypothetical protein QUS33_02485 [Dehalococcoidia bacterium]|nr:hypothetical protein [Dehalococcoidia bacterium]